jgi:DNA primase
MKAGPEDRILLLLSIKAKGKKIGFDHIAEKIIRDEKGMKPEEVKEILDEMVSRGLIFKENELFLIAPKGMKKITERLKEVGSELNLSYRMVLKAKEYYSKVAEEIMPFLKNRAVSVVKIFSDEKDPIRKIKPLFVRYSKYKPKPTFIEINSPEDLWRYVDAHAIDFIPYVHQLGSNEPDWFVLDLDAGPYFKKYERGFELVKIVAKKVVEVLEENGISPCIKFSGSRGIQIWTMFDNTKLPLGDLFARYRKLAVSIQKNTEERIKCMPSKLLDEFYKVTKRGKPITTVAVAKKDERKDQILIDWSSMKPSGDVRAPFSMHYKTGLISCPIKKEKLLDFDLEYAQPDNVARKINSLKDAFILEENDPSPLLRISS